MNAEMNISSKTFTGHLSVFQIFYEMETNDTPS